MEPSFSSKRKRDSDSFDEPSSFKRPKNDVFINYSCEDIGKGFISHLKGDLIRNGFSISDHTMLRIGEDKTSELLKDIEDSEICVVLFSINYAFSTECLDELVLIMDRLRVCKKRKVFPVFLNVDPSHVRNQNGSFMEPFQQHESNFDLERVQKWRQVLKDAGQLSGLTLQNGDEGKFLQEVITSLSKMKNPLELFDATHPVGIESRAQAIISKLRLGDNVFTIVVVLGIGGSGKTTIAKAVYDKIAPDFHVRCFIENIHDYEYNCRNWKVDLQKYVISCLTGNDQFYNVGAAMIKKLISGRKVLLVLDDVDSFEQLKALGIHPSSSFGYESRIIVTTRNKQSLGILPYTPYEIRLLNERESFELFSRLAFEKDNPVDRNFVYEVVLRAEGLPLVLEVWGDHFKCHERKEWPSILETLKRIPHEDIQKKLQISYDSLNNRAKKLFLDIACGFYNEIDLVVKVLQDEDSAFYPDNEIQNLVNRSLVKIYEYNKLSMHHVIREMGEEVVRRENEDEPGKRTRLRGRDVVHVLRDCSGTESVEGIQLGWYGGNKSVTTVQVEAFKKMSNLSNDDMCSFSFKKLKYLEWMEFPLKCLDNIDMANVVVIILRISKLEKLWENGLKSLQKLRILDVSWSTSLTNAGNFVGLEKLEKVSFTGCVNLEELDDSIGYLEKLLSLDLNHCTQLKSIPNLPPSIKIIKAHQCESLMNLPSNMPELESLTELNLNGCLKLGSEGFMNVTGLRNLHRLYMRNCNVSQVSSEIGNLVSLHYLDLSENPFSSLPDSFSNLSELNELIMEDCSELDLLPLLPSNITRLSYYVMQSDYVFRTIIIMLKESFFTKDKLLWTVRLEEEVPEWCSYRSNRDVLFFVAPIMHSDNKICGVIICATFTMDYGLYFNQPITMLNKTKETSHLCSCPVYNEDSMLLVFYPLNDKTLVVEAGDTVQLQLDEERLLSWGLRLIYERERPFTLTFPSPESTAAYAATSITQLYNEDLICSIPFQDKEIMYNLSN